MKCNLFRPKARRAFAPRVECVEVRVLMSVVASDPRRQVTNTTAYPYNTIVSVEERFPNGKYFIGSGAMIDPTHVLTVAHNIYSAKSGGWATEVTITPGLNRSIKPVGSYQVDRETTYSAYVKKSEFNDDLAVLTIDEPLNLPGNVVPVGTMNNNQNQEPVWTAGYPGDKGGTTMWQATGQAEGSRQRLSQFNLASTPGQSGSPIFEGSPNQPPVVISVVAGGREGDLRHTIGPQFTTQVAQDVKLWSVLDALPINSATFQPVKGKVGTYSFQSFVGMGQTHLLQTA